MGCIACGRHLHEECPSPVEETGECCCSLSPAALPGIGIGRPRKDDDEITVSAGRKRAAVDYPIYPEKSCEWRWQTNCGGGKFPIMGCIDGKQVNRHHGPNKNTSRNEPENIHRICSPCHNLWHARNDEHYDEDTYAALPHNPRPMTPEEMLMTR